MNIGGMEHTLHIIHHNPERPTTSYIPAAITPTCQQCWCNALCSNGGCDRIQCCLLLVLALHVQVVHTVNAHAAQTISIACLAQAVEPAAEVAVLLVPVVLAPALDPALTVLNRAHRHAASARVLDTR